MYVYIHDVHVRIYLKCNVLFFCFLKKKKNIHGRFFPSKRTVQRSETFFLDHRNIEKRHRFIEICADLIVKSYKKYKSVSR